MKTDQEKIAIMQAHLDGKKVECKANYAGSWHVNKTYGWNWEGCDYRIAPEPKLRPWHPNEVPLLAHLKTTIGDWSRREVICAVTPDGYVYIGNGYMTLKDLMHVRLYSIDYGKTWLPCGTME